MKIVTVLAATALAVASTSSYAGDVSDAGTDDGEIIFIADMDKPGSASLGSLGSGGGYAVAGLIGLALLAAAASGGGS